MRVEETGLPGVWVVHTAVHEDDRGFFTELHASSRYLERGIGPFVQDNHSRSRRGVLRGLHWQQPTAQGKLVSVVRGEIHDVVVDLTPGSPTQHQWIARVLRPGTQMWVPAGYAHGFCALSEVADVVYKCTAAYAPEHARGLRYDDPTLAIPWPMEAVILSDADAALPWLDAIDPDTLPRRAP